MGFPEECFLPQEYNFAGPDPKLDMVVALKVSLKSTSSPVRTLSHDVGLCECAFYLGKND
jgi:hypothetical protein